MFFWEKRDAAGVAASKRDNGDDDELYDEALGARDAAEEVVDEEPVPKANLLATPSWEGTRP